MWKSENNVGLINPKPLKGLPLFVRYWRGVQFRRRWCPTNDLTLDR